MTSVTYNRLFAMSAPLMPAPAPVIYSCCETGPIDESHVHKVIDLAACQNIQGVELGGHLTDIDQYVRYRKFPTLGAAVDEHTRLANVAMLRRIIGHAKHHDLRISMWHHELGGPPDLLQRLPALVAEDGLPDLDSPVLWDFVREKVAEHFHLFPDLDELVLTMTETQHPVAHRPFCDIPVSERIRRLLQMILDVTEPLGKRLVIRPFSAVRSDELHVREAVQMIKAKRVTMMYKTEPFDWHPFLENEPLIGSVPQYETRAETDCGAEYYGQAVIPCCYARHIERRLTAAASKGASTMVLRVDRGAHHSSLDHPINAANVIPVTRWLQQPDVPLEQHLRNWLAQTHGDGSPAFADLLHRTFDVIRGALYIDQHGFSHRMYPTLTNSKQVLALALFEPDVPSDHLKDIWSVMPGRRTPTHTRLLEEKRQAVVIARQLVHDFDTLAPRLRKDSRCSIRTALERLIVFAQACEQLCRLICAHLAEMWRNIDHGTESFAQEASRQLAIADDIDARCGKPFFPASTTFRRDMEMTTVMRQWVDYLRAERELEFPLRRAMEAEAGLLDYVLCGFCSEGHRPRKRAHSGRSLQVRDRWARETGPGPDEGMGYTLQGRANTPMRLAIDLADDGTGRPGTVAIAGVEHGCSPEPFHGFQTLCFDIPAQAGEIVDVRFWSTSPVGYRVATIRLYEAR